MVRGLLLSNIDIRLQKANIFIRAVRYLVFVQSVGFAHLSLDAISIHSFLEVAAGHGEERLMLVDFLRREIYQLDREKIIRFSLIEQVFDQFLLVEAFTFRESVPHGSMDSQPYRKSCSVKGLDRKAGKTRPLAVSLRREIEGERKGLLLVPSLAGYR